jgi:metal-responsive CopG/Arc/MetJ family transcriptional regulator
MSIQQKSQQLKITIPDTLYQRLLQEAQRRAQDISIVIQTALEQYVQQFDLTQTQTWHLCGTFTIAEPDSEYIVGSEDETGSPITNYAEHVDDILYKGN